MNIRFRGRVYAAMISIVAMTAAWAPFVSGTTNDAWQGCRPGPFGIGFTTTETYDYSRTYRDKLDDAGQPFSGELARPIQICIWYPARKPFDGEAVVFGEYVFPAPDDYRFFGFVSDLQNREVRNLVGLLGGDAGRGLDFQNRRMHAIRDVMPLDSTFPVVVYHCGLQHGIAENAFLFEYLASHGYVVAATHSVAAGPGLPEHTLRDLEAVARDGEFILARLFDQPNTDMGSVAVIGRGAGADAALIMQMRNDYVDAAALLDPPLGEDDYYEFVSDHPSFDIRQVDVPYLFYCRSDSAGEQATMVDSFPYAERQVVIIDGASSIDFTAYALAGEDDLGEASSHARICTAVLLFLDMYLKNNTNAGQTLETTATRLAAEERPPTESQFRNLLRQLEIDRALEIYERLHALYPERAILNEAVLNQVGYALIGANRIDDAVRIMRLNAETFSGSPNAWDSYADACLASGDATTAIQCYHRVLEILPEDTVTDARLKERLKEIAEHTLQELQRDDE